MFVALGFVSIVQSKDPLIHCVPWRYEPVHISKRNTSSYIRWRKASQKPGKFLITVSIFDLLIYFCKKFKVYNKGTEGCNNTGIKKMPFETY